MEADKKPNVRIYLAEPRGFCAGVERAIEIVERALGKYGSPVYVRHEIVHNRRVVDAFRARGVIFVEELVDVPLGAVAIFSAHGVSKAVETAAGARRLQVIDATCPLVTKVHNEGRRAVNMGLEVVLIGHAGHPEVEGTMGQIPGVVHLVTNCEDVNSVVPTDANKLAYVTQTTLSIDDTREIISALRRRFPSIVGPDVRDICYATQNRQASALSLAKVVDVMLVVGGYNSSNSNRLVEIARACGIAAYLIEDATAVRLSWFKGCESIGITAGASAPEELIIELVALLKEKFNAEIVEHKISQESVRFKLPPELADAGTLA